MSNFEQNRRDGFIWLWRSILPDYPELEEQVKTGIKPKEFDIWIEEPPSVAKFFRLLLLLATKREDLLKRGEVRRSLKCYSIFLSQYDRKKKKWVTPGRTTIIDWIERLEKAEMIYHRKLDSDLILGVTNYRDYQTQNETKEVHDEEHPNNFRTTSEQRKQRDEQFQNSEHPTYYNIQQEDITYIPPTQSDLDKIAFDYNKIFVSGYRKANGQDPGFVHVVSILFLDGKNTTHFLLVHKAAYDHWLKGMPANCRWEVLYRPNNFETLLEIAEIKPGGSKGKEDKKTKKDPYAGRFDHMQEGVVR